jgi:hypothetical protein
MLLGDGSPTRHLRLLTGEPVAIDLIAMEAEQGDHPGAPAEVQELQAPLYAARFGSPAAVHRWLGLKVGGIKLKRNCTSKTAISRSGKASPRTIRTLS